MPQVAVYFDDETARLLEAGANREGKSRSAFVRDAVREKLKSEPFPEWWFENLGTWEDDRSPEEILADIRSGPEQRERASFD
jgi:predicted transcriptional regulator